jgi:hypothetical protein
MRSNWGRRSAMVRLLAAIFGDLRRRAWWAYRTGGIPTALPRTTIVARQPTERQTYVPLVSADWRPLVSRALPVLKAGALEEPEQRLPLVAVDVATRPDVADLPRVLRSGRAADDKPAMATQWLLDYEADRMVLIVTFVEPVTCTFALAFEVPRWIDVLQQIAEAGELVVAWDALDGASLRGADRRAARLAHIPGDGLRFSIERPGQLRAILAAWSERQAA